MKASDSRALPKSGLTVTALGLGGAQMGGLYRETSYADADGAFRAAWDAGIRYMDTAPYYGYTRAERRLGTIACERERSSFRISTKAGRLMVPDDTVPAEENGWFHPLPFRPTYDYSYDGIMRSFEQSQQRLGLLHVDILYVHDIGRYTHADAHVHYWVQLTRGGGFKALLRLRHEGQVGAIGLGVNEIEVVHDAMGEADLDAVMLAGRYTLLEQQSLALLDACALQKIGVVVAGVFNSGILAGGSNFDYGQAPAGVVERTRTLRDLCARLEVPLPAAALQFPMAHPAVCSCVVGARNAEQMRSNVAWFEQDIPAAFWSALASSGLLAADTPIPGHA